jgi:hypothetical protein
MRTFPSSSLGTTKTKPLHRTSLSKSGLHPSTTRLLAPVSIPRGLEGEGGHSNVLVDHCCQNPFDTSQLWPFLLLIDIELQYLGDHPRIFSFSGLENTGVDPPSQSLLVDSYSNVPANLPTVWRHQTESPLPKAPLKYIAILLLEGMMSWTAALLSRTMSKPLAQTKALRLPRHPTVR